MSSTLANSNVQPKKNYTSAGFIIGMLFFVFGFVTWMNGTLIQFLKIVCELKNDVEAFFVTFAFYMAYFFLALPSSFILKYTGFKKGMALGLLVMALGTLVFIPAANARSFGLFLTGLFIQGMGLALLQTASNPYISIIGPIETAARRISFMGICNNAAGMMSPLILGAFVMKNASALETKITTSENIIQKNLLLNQLSSNIITPYIILALALAVLAISIFLSPLPHVDGEEDEGSTEDAKTKTNIYQFPYLWLGVLCLFVYVGVEVMAADAIGTYGRSSGISTDQTKYFTFYTLSGMMIGYIAGIIAIPKFISQQTGLTISAILGVLFSLLAFCFHGYVAIAFIALLGLANALMWPSIFPLAIDKLGRFTKTGSALLIMGIAGGAVIPITYGILKDKLNLSNSLSFFVCTFPCYVYILYYAIKGFKVGKA